MKKIAYVINYIVRNGPGNVVLSLIKNLDRTRFEVSLITLFNENDPEVVQEIQQQGVTVFACSSLTRMGCLCGKSTEFTQIVTRGQFDILHTHGFIPDVLSSKLKTSGKRITTLHNNMFEDYINSYGNFKGRFFIRMHLAALKKLDLCICCSESVYKVMNKYLRGVTYVRNGIEPHKAHSVVERKNLEIPEGAWVFLYAGALSQGKNVVWLVKNFVRYHNADEYLLILGTGPEENLCKAAADQHVQILGYQEDPLAYMNISDVYISASKSEGFSVSVLEALSCGLGLFLSDIPSHCEVVQLGKDVYLGETFGKGDFEKKLETIRQKRAQIKKINIKAFQRMKLSDRVMTQYYQKNYL